MTKPTGRARAPGASGAADKPPAPAGKRGRAFATLNAVLKPHLRRSADGRKVVANATVADRAEFYSRMVRQLHELGYRFEDVGNLKPKHVEALMRRWEAEGLSASTLQKRFSYLTLLCRWLGKASMLRPGPSYLNNPDAFRRGYAATRDRSWTAAGVDPDEKIAEVARADPDVARVLRLQSAFGLRVQEASLLAPERDWDGAGWLRVTAGTKGGRPRAVPVETESQRAALLEAARHAGATGRSMIPPRYDLKQWLDRCYHVFGRCGITREGGLVSHGLRHQYANDRYEELTGEPSPVRGGAAVAGDDHRRAQLEVSARLGHARPSITRAYYGKPGAGESAAPTPADAAAARAAAPEGVRPVSRAERRVQRQVLGERVRARVGLRADGRGPVAPGTLALRERLLDGIVNALARAGDPLLAPERLRAAQVDRLLAGWRGLAPQTARHHVQFLAQLCGWLDRPELARRARAAWADGRAGRAAPPPPGPWPEEEIRARLDAIRAVDPRAALHLSLVRTFDLTHRQAARLQPAAAYRDGALEVIWEAPEGRVLRVPVAGERPRAVLAEALALLPDPRESVCPPGLSTATWLRKVYDLLRGVGGIGGPGGPAFAALRDPGAPAPESLDRDAYLLARSGLVPPGRRGR
ncbi:MAG: integrase domain-containing protein [bacterium]|nr:integrase domain-containing protein [bacterium]